MGSGRRLLAAILLVVVAGCGGDDSRSQAGTAGARSQRRAPLPAPPRTELVGANWNGRIAVAGGMTQDGQPSAQVDVYDPATDTWSRAPDLPVALHHAGAGALGDRLFVVGGYSGATPVPQAGVYSLGPEPGATWRMEPPLAGPRAALAVASDGKRLVAVGGVGTGDTRRTEILEAGASSWRAGPDLAVQREHLAATFAGGRAYAIAGRMGSLESNRDSVESLAPGDASWRTEPKLNHSRGGIGAASPGGRACVAGGEEPGGRTVPTVECLSGGTWKVVGELEVPRHGLAVVAVGNRLHVIGGGPHPGLFVSDAHEVFEL
jgi:N-acetylneuraminic acid mutarotase